MPSYIAAMHFSLIPPTGRTLPLRVIYPVIDRFYRTGSLNSRLSRLETMVTPAEGPSFLVEPYGKWMWMEVF